MKLLNWICCVFVVIISFEFKGVANTWLIEVTFVYTGGNQRELARQKNAKKANEQSKGKRGDDGLSAAARKQRYGCLPEMY